MMSPRSQLTPFSPITLPGKARAGGRTAASLGGALLWAVLGCGGKAAPAAEVPIAAEPSPEPSVVLAPAREVVPETVVHAELQTSAQAIRPGGTFLVAVRFDIHPGYRISWTNPGDQGRPTRVELQAPPGFEVGAVRFPAPRRFALPGGFVSYGYENQTAVFVEVKAPRGLSSSRAYRFDVKADWLACKDDCANEELSAWFELAANHRAPAPQLPSELSEHYAALPSAFADLPESNHDWNGSPRRPALRLSASEVKWVDFFPGDDPAPTLLAVQPRGDVLEMRFERLGREGNLHGLAFGEVDGRLASFDVNVPLPQ